MLSQVMQIATARPFATSISSSVQRHEVQTRTRIVVYPAGPNWPLPTSGDSCGEIKSMPPTSAPESSLDGSALRGLHYAAAIGCGVLTSLAIHILLTVTGYGLDAALHGSAPTSKQEFVSALAWWGIGGAGFLGGWAAGAYLIAAAREREFVYRLARAFLIAVVVVICTAAGLLSKTTAISGTVDVIASLTALALGLICAFCGARLAYLNAEQV
jgi:hypothetical protein